MTSEETAWTTRALRSVFALLAFAAAHAAVRRTGQQANSTSLRRIHFSRLAYVGVHYTDASGKRLL
ncbi:hypothetical protein GGR50DRAFT_690668 [Xylaria sp. CBS 124048]|nr:hypothetical protein GGR50DRAFT_690668 [Xylaria sp. CBS 124048]